MKTFIRRSRWALALAIPTSIASGATNTTDPPNPSNGESAEAASSVVSRVALLGAYRKLWDISLAGAGIEVSLGGEGPHHGGYFNFRWMQSQTAAGLSVFELGFTGTYEACFNGVRFGAGSGLMTLNVRRATNGAWIRSTGVEALLRFGYDFGRHMNFYVLGQLDGQWHPEGKLFDTWGPTVYFGFRF